MGNTTSNTRDGASKLAYRLEQAAEAIGAPRTAIYAAITEGRLRTYKVGRGRYVSADALREFIAEREAEARVAA